MDTLEHTDFMFLLEPYKGTMGEAHVVSSKIIVLCTHEMVFAWLDYPVSDQCVIKQPIDPAKLLCGRNVWVGLLWSLLGLHGWETW